MSKLTLPILMVVLLVPAATAVAKEPVAAKICGPSDCTTVKDKDTLMNVFMNGGGPTDPPRHGAAWYSVRIAIDTGQEHPDHFEMAIVPSQGLLRSSDGDGAYGWYKAPPDVARAYRRLTDGIAPFAAAKLDGVGPVEAKVDEVIMPPAQPEPAAAADGGGSSPPPWIAAGVVVLLGLALALVRWRGLPWASRPASP
jgi:hypothetical protein